MEDDYEDIKKEVPKPIDKKQVQGPTTELPKTLASAG